jgi:hypothetical protein
MGCSGCGAERFAATRDDVRGLAKRTEDPRHRCVPAVARLQRSKLQDLMPIWCFQREPHRFMRTLTSDLHVASTAPLPIGSPRRRI